MKAAVSVLCTLFALGAATAHAAEGTFTRTLKVSGPVLIGLNTSSGNVHVHAVPGNTVQIVGHVRSSGMFGGNGGDERVQAVVKNPPVTQAGNIISIGHNFDENGISIDYDVTTPRPTDLRVNSGSGDITDDATGGPTELTTGSGNIRATGLTEHVTLRTGSGIIDATMLSARDVQAESGNGNVVLHGVQGSLWAHSGSGNVTVDGRPIAGAWRVEAGSGNVNVDLGSAGYDLNATTGSGVIQVPPGVQVKDVVNRQHVVGQANGGGPTVRLNTGSGNIVVR